jgi:uncharacterized RDD family membrane protein YckC
MVDWALVSSVWSVLAVGVAFLKIINTDLAQMVAIVSYFLLSQGYRMASEWLWRGQTLGKRLLRLRVVDERGLRLTFAQIALRNLLRFVDQLPGAYLVGGVAMLTTRRGQRLGDLAAGTLVVWEATEIAPDPALLQSEKYNSLREYPSVVTRLRQAVTAGEAQTAWRALGRRPELTADARVRVFEELANHFRAITPIPGEALDGISDEQLVRNVVDVLYVTRR